MEIHDGKDIMITSRFGALLPVSLLYILLLAGCKEPAGDDFIEGLLTIDLTIHYQDDSVRVTLNDSLLYAQVVTTDYILSMAKRTQLLVASGFHRFEIYIVNNDIRADTTFEMEDTLSIGVIYDNTEKKLSIVLYDFITRPH